MPSGDRSLRTIFDRAAKGYDAARPEYPAALLDTLSEAARLGPGATVLELGCASGKATRRLAERGFEVTALELAPALAREARLVLEEFPKVRVLDADFDRWEPEDTERFDVVVAATAWHWLDPATRCARAWRSLRPGGHLAVWSASHVFPLGGDPIFAELQPVYDAIGEGLPPDAPWPRPGELPPHGLEAESEGGFETVEIAHFDWETVHDADSYIALLETFSGHLAMPPWKRARLHDEVRRRLAARPDGRLRRHWGAVLEVARRREADA